MKRSIIVLVGAIGLAVWAPGALAADSSTDSSGGAAATSSTTSTALPATTSAPTTVAPTTATSTTATTTTVTPATTTATTTTATDTPTTTAAPSCVDCATPPCTVDCIPDDVPATCTAANCIPSAGGAAVPTAVGAGSALPFTGIGDMVAPLLLALTVVLGGVVAWRWAQLREAVARDAWQARRTPASAPTRSTGYDGAARQLQYEKRARRMLTPRVA